MSMLFDRCSIQLASTNLLSMGWADSTIRLSYGKRLIKHRRMLNQYLYRKRTENYYPVQLEASRRVLQDMLESPSGYQEALLR